MPLTSSTGSQSSSVGGLGGLGTLPGAFTQFRPALDAAGQGEVTIESLSSRQHSFSQVLGRESRRTLPTRAERARETAEQFVASSLVEPILKQMRSATQAPPPLGPSQGEKQFRSLMDTQVARNIVKRSRWNVVDRIASDLMKRTNGVSA